MKRASYREAIEFIVMNDEPTMMEEWEMMGFASVLLIASIFGVTQERVAHDVIRVRVSEAKAEAKRDRESARMEKNFSAFRVQKP